MEPYIDSIGGQLIQRSVIVQKDERGYGLTVSGDNPVFVQNVKDYGAAYKAGVRQGDRIIKVNGTLVTQSNHMEVVNMIKAGSYVALTLLGRPPGSTQPLPPPHQPNQNSSNRTTVSGPRPAAPEKDAEMRNERVTTMRKMLDQEKDLYEKTKAEYFRSPTEKLQKDLSGATTRVKVLEHQLAKLAGISSVQTLGSKDLQFPGFMFYVTPPSSPVFRENCPSFSNPDSPASDTDTQRSPEDVIRERREKNRLTWLSQGGLHARQRSSPDTFFHQESHTKKTSLKRNNSDAYRNDSRSKGLRQHESMSQKSRLDNSQLDFLSSGISLDSDSAADSSPNTTPPIQRHGFIDDGDGETCKLGTSPQSHLAGMEPVYHTISNDDGHVRSQSQIMCMEDEEFQSDGENTSPVVGNTNCTNNKFNPLEDHGPFNDLESLVKRPAHMAVFMHYLISNSDPSSLFFYLVTESYGTGSLKDMKKWCYEIFSTFLAPTGPLRIQVEENVVQKIESILSNSMDNEQAMKKVFVVARDVATTEIRDLLGDYRSKRALGLGSIFGDQMLSNEDMDKASELRVVEQTLMPHLERLSKNQAEKEDKNVAMAAAINTFMKQVGVKENSLLERVQSFAAKDKSKLKIGKKGKSKITVKGHTFIDYHCTGPVFCHHCKGLLWGVGYQGLQCQNCEMTIHRTSPCVDQLDKVCNKKDKRQSLMNILFIKGNPSNNSTGSGDRNPLSPDEVEGKVITSPSPTNLGKVIPMVQRHEDAEVMDEMHNRNIVGSMINQFEMKDDSLSMLDTCNVMDILNECSEEEEGQPVRRSNLSRSESLQLKGEEKIKAGHGRRSKSSSDRAHCRSVDDVDLDTEKANSMMSQCSSSSSMSTRSHDSLFSSCETTFRHEDNDDSDLDVENVIPNWQDNVSKELLKKMKSKDIKRQEIINELFHTERTHVRGLKVLDRVFFRPMQAEHILDQEIKFIFPNLPDLIEVHTSLNNAMKKHKEASSNNVIEEVGDILLNKFDGAEGERMRKVCATFCENQAAALENLKAKQAKDTKVAQFMMEAESNHLCRRLPFPGIISIVYQRITKYPLLIENLLKYTQSSSPEAEKLQKSLECSKQVLGYVNQAVKECENQQKLNEISRRMDTSPLDRSSNPIVQEYKNIDITSRKLLHYGDLTWKIGKTKKLDLHVLLLDDILVLLQKQDERYVLKCHSMTVQRGDDVRNTHSPIVKLATLLCRNVATNKKAFFLVSTQITGPQIYELVAATAIKRQAWMDVILAAQEAAKKRPSRRREGRVAPMPPPIPAPDDRSESKTNEVIVTPTQPSQKPVVVEGPKIFDGSVTVVRVEEAVRHKTRTNSLESSSRGFDVLPNAQQLSNQDITTPLTDILKKSLAEDASSKDVVQYLMRLTRKCKQTIELVSDKNCTKIHIDHISLASDMYTQRLKELMKSLINDDKHMTEMQKLLESEKLENEKLKQRIAELEAESRLRTVVPSDSPATLEQVSSLTPSDNETNLKVLKSNNKDSNEEIMTKSTVESYFNEEINEINKVNETELKTSEEVGDNKIDANAENNVQVYTHVERTGLEFENIEHNCEEQVTNLDDSDRLSTQSDDSHSYESIPLIHRKSESGSGSDHDVSPRNTLHFAVTMDSSSPVSILNKENFQIEPLVENMNKSNQVDEDDDDDGDITIPAYPEGEIEAALPTGQLHHVKMAKEEVVMHEAPEFLHDSDAKEVTIDVLPNSRPHSLISVGSSTTTEGMEYMDNQFESEAMHAILSKEKLLEHGEFKEHENLV
ncbi:rho guanine nucleotide exchange factor 11-like isoform X3 [Anneissia japonica]|uniref:rho guanine nucleotide exchange factor 11-like isoform X3 n=1 Tax=Anneissia japonica TaxID=1529436 RepID=UPI0014254F8C|nr:rho guanine nucleotide exchange factor 11-like isoform X3 [Anneissia japonica]